MKVGTQRLTFSFVTSEQPASCLEWHQRGPSARALGLPAPHTTPCLGLRLALAELAKGFPSCVFRTGAPKLDELHRVPHGRGNRAQHTGGQGKTLPIQGGRGKAQGAGQSCRNYRHSMGKYSLESHSGPVRHGVSSRGTFPRATRGC